MKIKLLFLLLTGLVAQASAQTLVCQMLDSASHAPLAGVTLRVAGGGAVTGPSGIAVLNGLPAGKNPVTASYLGYRTRTILVTVPAADTVEILLAPEPEQLDEIVIQSLRTGSRAEDTPTKVEVLGPDDMVEENGLKPGNVASILGDYSGVQIQQTSLNSGNAGIRIQGLASRYTQVLRDGMPLYAGLAGDFGILQVQPLDLQQIELIKNPASTLFGGGAIAGVVNFISKSPGRTPERAFSLNQTTLAETNATAWVSGRNEKHGYTCFAGYNHWRARDVDGDGFSDVPDGQSVTLHPRFFRYGRRQSQLALGLTLTADTRSGGDIEALRHGPHAAHPYLERNNTQRQIADLQWQQPVAGGRAAWQAKAAAGVFRRFRATPDWYFAAEQLDWFSEISYRYSGTGAWRWVAGANFSGSRFRPESADSLAFGSMQYATPGLFGQLAWHRNRWDAEAGFRLDARSTWGAFPLPSGALLYRLNTHWYLRAGFGLGYAVPNPLTLASDVAEGDLRRILAPDPKSVQAERSAGGNLEWNYHRLFGDAVSVSFNQQFFYTRFANPVTTILLPSGMLRPVNAPDPLTAAGVDHYLRLDLWETELYLGYTYVLARQHWNKSQPYVPLTPRHRAAGVLARAFGDHFRAGIEASWTGPQLREDGTDTPAYLFMAAMVGFTFGPFQIIVNGENLLDYRQTRAERVVLGTPAQPVFVPLWAPVDGRVLNLALVWRGEKR